MGSVVKRKPYYLVGELYDRWSIRQGDVAAYALVGGLTLFLPVAAMLADVSDVDHDAEGGNSSFRPVGAASSARSTSRASMPSVFLTGARPWSSASGRPRARSRSPATTMAPAALSRSSARAWSCGMRSWSASRRFRARCRPSRRPGRGRWRRTAAGAGRRRATTGRPSDASCSSWSMTRASPRRRRNWCGECRTGSRPWSARRTCPARAPSSVESAGSGRA